MREGKHSEIIIQVADDVVGWTSNDRHKNEDTRQEDSIEVESRFQRRADRREHMLLSPEVRISMRRDHNITPHSLECTRLGDGGKLDDESTSSYESHC